MRAVLVKDLDQRAFRLLGDLWKRRRKKVPTRASVELHRKASILRASSESAKVQPGPRFLLREGEYVLYEPSDKEDQHIAEIAAEEGAEPDDIQLRRGTYARVESTLRRMDRVSVVAPAAIVTCDRHVQSTKPERVPVRNRVWESGPPPRIPSAEEAGRARVLQLGVLLRERIILCPEGVSHVAVGPGELVGVMHAPSIQDAIGRFFETARMVYPKETGL